MDTIVVNELVNIGLTLLVLFVGWLGVMWLDRNVFNKGRYKRSNEND